MNNEEFLQDEFVKQGYDDCYSGVENHECPHDVDTDAEHGWKLGWKIANEERAV